MTIFWAFWLILAAFLAFRQVYQIIRNYMINHTKFNFMDYFLHALYMLAFLDIGRAATILALR